MDNASTPETIRLRIGQLFERYPLPEKYRPILFEFYRGVANALEQGNRPTAPFDQTFLQFIDLIERQQQTPFAFEPYHAKIREPIDCYRFSLEFVRPLIDFPRSTLKGRHVLDTIEQQLAAGENAILLANHQTETDPQIISLLLEKDYPGLAERIIYVAGERVVTDPLAIPFSMGCDLLCIYSKRYIDHPPELKAKKQLHNKHTMERMSRLLAEGGRIIYVAPSGGRDRKNREGVVEIARFDPQSIEMFYLMARKAKTPTHFHPLALSTYDLMPPPETVQVELGEARVAKFTPVAISFLPEFPMDSFPGSEEPEKNLRRQKRSDLIWEIVNTEYQTL